MSSKLPKRISTRKQQIKKAQKRAEQMKKEATKKRIQFINKLKKQKQEREKKLKIQRDKQKKSIIAIKKRQNILRKKRLSLAKKQKQKRDIARKKLNARLRKAHKAHKAHNAQKSNNCIHRECQCNFNRDDDLFYDYYDEYEEYGGEMVYYTRDGYNHFPIYDRGYSNSESFYMTPPPHNPCNYYQTHHQHHHPPPQYSTNLPPNKIDYNDVYKRNNCAPPYLHSHLYRSGIPLLF